MARRESKTIKDWEAKKRSALRPTPDGDIIENLLRVPLNSRNPKDGYFDLYYFVQPPTGGPARKTVLFCAGGPGEIVRGRRPDETFAGFLSLNEYNVVFFHQRGSGFSQIPPSNRCDRFLRTSYAVKDIEAIRRGLLGKDGKWDGIIAWSYGTVLAQQYAHFHSDRVRKLILLAPLSRHMFKGSVNAFDELKQDVRRIHRQNLERIYDSKEFEDDFGLMDSEKKRIIEKLFGTPNDPKKKGVFETTEDAFGSIQFVVNEYFDLKQQGELRKYGIHKYGRDFFRKLRDLRRVGSSTLPKGTRGKRLGIGKELRDELLDRKKANDERRDLYIQDSDRAFYVIETLDGINPRFLKELSGAGAKDIRGALRKSGGIAHFERGINKSLENVRISDREKIEPWDPAKYSHSVPTLVLKGEADPVTAGGQSEYIFSEALKGPRTLIEFPGIGHDFSLPSVGVDDIPILSGVIRFDPRGISPGTVRAVKGTIIGRRLNEKLRMNLEPPADVKTLVNIAAVAFLEEEKIEHADKATNNIIALVENTTGRVLRLNLKNSYWSISCHFFAGTVQFSGPTSSGEVRLDPGETRILYGTVVCGGRNSQRLYHLEPDGKLEDGLEMLGFNIDGTLNMLHVWLKAVKQVRDTATRKWTISRGSFKNTFRVTPPSLEEGQLVEVMEKIDGLKSDRDEELKVEMTPSSEETIVAHIPQEEPTDTIPIILSNGEDKAFNGRPGNWLIDNRFFSLSVSVDPPEIPAKSGVKISGTIKGLRRKRWLEIKKPADLDSGLELLGFNILGEDKISLLLRNTGRRIVKGGAREWIYIDPNEKMNSNALTPSDKSTAAISLVVRTPLLNRLIYLFLVMDTGQFSDEKRNENLKVIRDAFKGDSVLFKIKYSDRERHSGGHKVVNKRRLIGLDNVRKDSLLEA
jgi:pimeloyl-ACP methyl ester carboxylesterase